MVLGSGSNVGKSSVVLIVSKLLQEVGYKVAPFKAQNVSNNSIVTDDNKEIAIAQHFQATALGLKTTPAFNPILLKIESSKSNQLIVNGSIDTKLTPKTYYQQINRLKPIVKDAFMHLSSKYDIIVAEGAGSCVELNLLDKDLSNQFIAKEFNTKNILVVDISNGGVFAQIYGTLNLLDKQIKDNIIGVIINKFQGDISLFEDGIKIIQEQFNIPVLGVLPYIPFNLGFEDMASLKDYKVLKTNPIIKVGVISYPKISNFNDIEPLINDQNLDIEFINGYRNLDSFDMIILPGSKNINIDLKWIKANNLSSEIKKFKGIIIAICGGFEILCNKIKGNNIEFDGLIDGLNLIDDNVYFKQTKNLQKGIFDIFNMQCSGFLLHQGYTKKYPLYYHQNNIYATFLHQLFDNDNFRNYIFTKINKNYKPYNFKQFKNHTINNFISQIKPYMNFDLLLK